MAEQVPQDTSKLKLTLVLGGRPDPGDHDRAALVQLDVAHFERRGRRRANAVCCPEDQIADRLRGQGRKASPRRN
jgi:hypothetical protein